LSLVRHISRAHGGDIEVESTPGRGSKFTLSLPLTGPAMATA
jgi:two-component system phosphate regulon sensor histidine kinase PhoR